MKSGWPISVWPRRLGRSWSFPGQDPDAPRALTIYVPLTTQNRGSKYEVVLPKLHFLREVRVANVQGAASLTANRLERKLGEVSPDVLRRIREALAFAIGMA